MSYQRKGKENVHAVACPFCRADIGVHCFQVSHMRRTGVNKWIIHKARKDLFEKEKKNNEVVSGS